MSAESADHPFEEVGDGEPHRIRREEILKKYPKIRDMDGYDTRTAWVTLAVACFQMFVAWTHVKAAENGTFWGTKTAVFFNAWIFGAILAHWLGQTIHETSHDLAFKKRIHNKMLAFFEFVQTSTSITSGMTIYLHIKLTVVPKLSEIFHR